MNGITLSLMSLLLTLWFLNHFFQNLLNYLSTQGAL